MKLQNLFSIFPGVPENAYSEIEIQGIYNNSDHVQLHSVFVAIRGTKIDGHDFLNAAISKGAIALVVQDKGRVPSHFEGFVLVVPDTRSVLDIIAARFYGYPANNLFCIGVTGTNGKTSLCYLVEAILCRGRISTGVIGTVDHHLDGKSFSTTMTTPDALELQARLAEFLAHGARATVMEVTSHALAQKRVDSVNFNTVVFTNLSHDHLDFHENMKSYFQAKQRLFRDLIWHSHKSPIFAIINIDDKWGRQLAVADPAILWTYGKNNDAQFQFKVIKMTIAQTRIELKHPLGTLEIALPLLGLYNIYNAVAAFAVGMSAGISPEICKNALESFTGVPGRLQKVANSKNLQVYIDYAHTPDALENVLRTLKDLDPSKEGGKLIVLFGCGGDRDRTKRGPMGQIAYRYADKIFITSDNPRTENPKVILDEISAGIFTSESNLKEFHRKVIVEENRVLAIQQAIQMIQPKDVLIIAGKGHETYQIIGQTRYPFDDYQEAQKAIEEK